MMLHELIDGPHASVDEFDKAMLAAISTLHSAPGLQHYLYVHPKTLELLRRARRHGLRRYSTWGRRKLRRMSRKQRTVWLQHWNAWKP